MIMMSNSAVHATYSRRDEASAIWRRSTSMFALAAPEEWRRTLTKFTLSTRSAAFNSSTVLM